MVNQSVRTMVAGFVFFQAGAEILLLKRIDTQWLYGKCGQEEGMFPQSFVEIIEDLPVESQTQDQKVSFDWQK